LKSLNTPKCFVCGSPLIFVSEVTELPEGSRFPQTTIKYRCSNLPCQEEKDKQTAKRLKIVRDKAKKDKIRLKQKLQEKKDAKLLKDL
jgi:hypothetical protein